MDMNAEKAGQKILARRWTRMDADVKNPAAGKEPSSSPGYFTVSFSFAIVMQGTWRGGTGHAGDGA